MLKSDLAPAEALYKAGTDPMVTLLLATGADARAKDSDWKDALALAKEDGNAAIIALREQKPKWPGYGCRCLYLRTANASLALLLLHHLISIPMKKTLLALALCAFAATTAFAHDGHDKDGKKGKKEVCSKSMAGGSCCMKGGKTASVKPAAKAPATAKM